LDNCPGLLFHNQITCEDARALI